MTEKLNEKVSPDNSVNQNREIKFKGLIKGQHFKGFVYGYYYYSKKFDQHQIWDEDGNIHVIDKQTLGQYTGLKDKHGIDIYEGDICKVLYTDRPSKSSDFQGTIDDWKIHKSRTLVVNYDFNGFYFSKRIGGYNEDMDVGKFGQIIIIGNLCKNPELLSE